MATTNGRPEAEVIVNFVDGHSYSKKALQTAFDSGAFDIAPIKKHKETSHASDLKKEYIDLIVHEFEISRIQAEKALAANKGDIQATLKTLVSAPAL